MNKKRGLIIALIMATLILVFGGVQNNAYAASDTMTLKDNAGKKVTVPKKIKHVADLSGVNTPILLMVGGEKKLVVTTPEMKANKLAVRLFPALKKDVVPFNEDTLNTEELNAQNPDLVISSNKSQIETLNNSSITVVNSKINNYTDLEKAVTLTGKIIGGDAKTQAIAYNDQLESDISEVGNRTRQAGVPKVLHIVDKADLARVDGKNSMADQWIDTAGGKNVVKSKGRNIKLSTREIKKSNPDAIFVGGMSTKDALKALQKDSRYKSLKAVKNKKVYGNPTGIARWDGNSAETDLQLWYVASKIHPEEVKDVNITNKVKNFYMGFYNHKFSTKEVKQMLAGETIK